MSDTASFGYGQQDPNDSTDEFNKVAFLVQQIMGRLSTMKLVQVQAVNGMTVNVLPLVNQVDGAGNATPHGTVYNIPFKRVQSGANAIIMDPQVGDIGYVVVADRDISSVKNTKKQANPGSARRFDLADGVYEGGLLNAPPTQYIEYTDSGINIKTPLATTEGDSHATGDITGDKNISTATGNISAPGGQVSAQSIAAAGSAVANAANPLLTAAGGVAVSGGFTETMFTIPPPANGGTITPNPSDNQKQLVVNNVAGFTIAATSQVGDVELVIVNGASAGTITFTGFSPSTGWAGDPLDTVNGHEFVVFIFGMGGGKTAYTIKALQ